MAITTDRMDVGQWRKSKNDKDFFVRLGSAITLKNGNIAIYLDALPMPGPDGCQLTIQPPRERRIPVARTQDPNDDIPF